MTPSERALARLLARSTLGQRLRAVDEDLRELLVRDLFAGLDDARRRRLERRLSAAGDAALYAFIAPYVAAVGELVEADPAMAHGAEVPPAPPDPPRAGEWIRADPGEPWHRFTGDLRIRSLPGRTETVAEARCGAGLPIASTSGPAALARGLTPPRAEACAGCRGPVFVRRPRVRRSRSPRL